VKRFTGWRYAWYWMRGTCQHRIRRWKCIPCSMDREAGREEVYFDYRHYL